MLPHSIHHLPVGGAEGLDRFFSHDVVMVESQDPVADDAQTASKANKEGDGAEAPPNVDALCEAILNRLLPEMKTAIEEIATNVASRTVQSLWAEQGAAAQPGATLLGAIQPGRLVTVEWTFTNSGSAPWPAGTRLRFVKGKLCPPVGFTPFETQVATVVGGRITTQAAAIPPNEPGPCEAHWQLEAADGAPLSPPLVLHGIVLAGTPPAPAAAYTPEHPVARGASAVDSARATTRPTSGQRGQALLERLRSNNTSNNYNTIRVNAVVSGSRPQGAMPALSAAGGAISALRATPVPVAAHAGLRSKMFPPQQTQGYGNNVAVPAVMPSVLQHSSSQCAGPGPAVLGGSSAASSIGPGPVIVGGSSAASSVGAPGVATPGATPGRATPGRGGAHPRSSDAWVQTFEDFFGNDRDFLLRLQQPNAGPEVVQRMLHTVWEYIKIKGLCFSNVQGQGNEIVLDDQISRLYEPVLKDLLEPHCRPLRVKTSDLQRLTQQLASTYKDRRAM